MRKLLIGILIATFISAFIIVYLSNYTTSLNAITLNWKDMGKILEKWIAILGIVAIPVVLWYMNKQEQDKKDQLIQEEKQRQDEKDIETDRQNSLIRIRMDLIAPLLERINTTKQSYHLILGDSAIVDKGPAIKTCLMALIPLNDSICTKLRSMERYLLPQEKEIFSKILDITSIVQGMLNQYISRTQLMLVSYRNELLALIDIVCVCVDHVDEFVIYNYSKNKNNDGLIRVQELGERYTVIIKEIAKTLQIDLESIVNHLTTP